VAWWRAADPQLPAAANLTEPLRVDGLTVEDAREIPHLLVGTVDHVIEKSIAVSSDGASATSPCETLKSSNPSFAPLDSGCRAVETVGTEAAAGVQPGLPP
jgi:hypothetical protein